MHWSHTISRKYPKVYRLERISYCYKCTQKCTQSSSHHWAWRVWLQVIGFMQVLHWRVDKIFTRHLILYQVMHIKRFFEYIQGCRWNSSKGKNFKQKCFLQLEVIFIFISIVTILNPFLSLLLMICQALSFKFIQPLYHLMPYKYAFRCYPFSIRFESTIFEYLQK